MEEILNFLRKEFEDFENHSLLIDFFHQLYNGNREEKLLLCCLGIDVKHQLISKEYLHKLLIDFLSTSNSKAIQLAFQFGNFLEKNSHCTYFKQAEGTDFFNYVRVITEDT